MAQIFDTNGFILSSRSSAATPIVWDRNRKTANINLNNNDTEAQHSNAANGEVRSTNAHSSGLLQIEFFSKTQPTSDCFFVGVKGASAAVDAVPNTAGQFAYLYRSNGATFYNGSSGAGKSTWAVNDTVQLCINQTTGKGWWGKNGTFTGNPAAGTGEDFTFTGGTNFNAVVIMDNLALNKELTEHFNTADLVVGLQSGFSVWGI